jgi:hypothetical protein
MQINKISDVTNSVSLPRNPGITKEGDGIALFI